MRNPLHTQASFTLWNLGGGHLTGAASYWAPPCARDPKTSESSNDQIKSAERTSSVRGTRATGRLQNTQEKGRQFSAVRRLTPSRQALQAAALSHYLMDVMASLSCPTHQRSPQMLCVRTGSSSSRYHGNCSSARALGDRERVLTHPARQRPPPNRPHVLIGRAGRGRALRPPLEAGDEPRAPPGEAAGRVSCVRSLARRLAEWLAGAVAILSLGNKVPPIPGLWGMRLVPASKMAAPTGNQFVSHMATFYLCKLRSL